MAEGLVGRQQQLVPSSDRMLKRPRHYGRQEEDVDHIVVEILSWLPVKSLLRFRSVCKSWCTLISGSYFVKKHLSHAGTFNSFRLLLFNLLHTSPKTIDYQGLKGHHNTHQLGDFAAIIDRSIILGSCNGLICLQETTRNGLDSDDIYLWNPSTRVTKKLPQHTFPNWVSTFYGFVYDSTAEDYKVILGNGGRIAIFTLKTGSWRTVEDFEFGNCFLGRGCFVNGALHWTEFCDDSMKIFSFDLAKEKFEQLCHLVCTPLFKVGIGTIRNSLCYYSYSTVRSMPFRIWVMKEYGVDKPWTKLMQIPTHNIRHKTSLMPKLILENGEVLMTMDAKDFLIYNPKENELRTVFKSRTILRSAAVVMYSETLVTPEFSSGRFMQPEFPVLKR